MELTSLNLTISMLIHHGWKIIIFPPFDREKGKKKLDPYHVLAQYVNIYIYIYDIIYYGVSLIEEKMETRLIIK